MATERNEEKEEKNEKVEKWPTSVDQRIQFILAVSQLGTTTAKMKRSFVEYFEEMINTHIKDPDFRKRLGNIPTIIRNDLDPDSKIVSIEDYRAAIIKCVLDDLVNEQKEKFFIENQSKETEEAFNTLLNSIRAEEDTRIRLQAYIKNIIDQNNQLELMALAISLSMRSKMESLEEEQAKLINQISTDIYNELKEDKEFDRLLSELKDADGSPVVIDMATWKEIISASLKQYTDECADHCIRNNRVPFDNPAIYNDAPVVCSPVVHGYQNQANNSFSNFKSQHPQRFSEIVQTNLVGMNINIQNSPQLYALGNKVGDKIQNYNKNKLTEVVNKSIEIKSISQHKEDVNNRAGIKDALFYKDFDILLSP